MISGVIFFVPCLDVEIFLANPFSETRGSDFSWAALPHTTSPRPDKYPDQGESAYLLNEERPAFSIFRKNC
jgi:hypothetical protein